MEDCIFCKIIKGEIPSKTIYEDETIKVIMNINPISNGHLLVLPKNHITDINDMNDNVINHSFTIIKEKLYPMLKKDLNCKGLTLCQNNELGQEIKHFHIHLIPRYENDNIDYNYNKDSIEDIETIFNKLK